MKITKTKEEALRKQLIKEKANQGCDICPCCGESKSLLYYLKLGHGDRGIFSGGVMHQSGMRIDTYVCATCGAQWESDPYEA